MTFQICLLLLQDTAEFALHFQQETPIKKGQFSLQDRHLLERVLSQVSSGQEDSVELETFVFGKHNENARVTNRICCVLFVISCANKTTELYCEL